MTQYFIGVDAGSTLCKAAVFDLEGRQLSVAQQRTPLSRPAPGQVEADPETCWQAACSVIRRAVETAGIAPEALGGIAISAAMVGAWLLDAQGRPLRPGINWEDSRSQPLIEALQRARPGLMSEIFDSSGSAMQQGCTLPVLAALKQQEPQLVARAAHVVSYKDVLRFRLTGAIAIDRSEAAVAPGCARTQTGSAAMRALFGLEAQAHLFPPVLPSTALAGRVTEAAARATGLPQGLPVAVGAGDVICTVLGAGGLTPGAATAVLGTTCMVGRVLDAPSFAPRDLGLLFSLPDAQWYRAMVNVAGTLNLDWALDLLAPDLRAQADCYDALTRMVAEVPVGARGVTYLPYLSESGIIAPVVSTAARAQFAGLTAAHGRAEMLRAVYEGVAFAIRDLLAGLGIARGETITLTGGGGQSRLWCDIIAAATGCTVEVPDGTEFGARGAAMLAAIATGAHADTAAVTAVLARQGRRRHLPPGEGRADWDAALARYAAYRTNLLKA